MVMTTSSHCSSSSASHTDRDNKSGNEEKTPKVRADLSYLFEKELTVKQNKRIYIVDEFNATERVTPIDGKFYSKFNDANIKDNAQRRIYWELADQRRKETRMSEGFPALESQVYGWMPKSMNVMALKQVNYIRAPKRRCVMTVFGEKQLCERVTERPIFTGKQQFYLS